MLNTKTSVSSTRTSVLLVDDESSIRATMSNVLAGIGFRVRLAEDGIAALREIRNDVPSILVSDLNMPGMSGFELLSVVRRRFPSIHVIAMSGFFTAMKCPPALPQTRSFKRAAASPVS